MAATAIVQAEVDETLKLQAEKIFADQGTTLSEALRSFLVETVEFESRPFRPNAETIAAMEEARRGENMTSVASIEELMAHIHAED